MTRPTLASFSCSNLLHNLNIIKQKAGNCNIAAAIKANGYGHGIKEVAATIANYVDFLAVASLDEVLLIQSSSAKILLLEGVFSKEELRYAIAHNLSVVFHNFQQISWLEELQSKSLDIWLKLDSGMSRLGFLPEEIGHAHKLLSKYSNQITLISHFASADEQKKDENTLKQINCFNDIKAKYKFARTSLANSAGVFRFGSIDQDIVRVGISLYGGSPMEGKKPSDFDLKPVMTLGTELISVKQKSRGDRIGYSGRYLCTEPIKMGVAAIGYGDGYPRSATDGTPILVDGYKCKLAGRVSMDMITIDLTNHPSPKIGSKVILWGDELSVDEVAGFTAGISYDLLTGVTQRVNRIWKD